MMRDVMDGAMGWMMGSMGLFRILIILVLVLGAVALLKYLWTSE